MKGPLRIVSLPIETESDVVAARQRARRLAELVGFDRQDQTRIATAVSEIARNAFVYAGGGRAECLIDQIEGVPRLLIRISDKGNGITNLDDILDGRYKSGTGMGLGLIGARRLMGHFRIETEAGKGTVVELGHRLPNGSTVTPKRSAEIAETLKRETSQDPLAALREQNRELMQSLEEIGQLRFEGEQISQELQDTNRGVVALYAELEERAEQLKKASELKTRFLSNISHEFRTPLNSVLALSRLLMDRVDGDLTPEQEKQVGFIRRSAESLLDLVNDLLDLAKVEAGKIDVRADTFKISALFGALRGALRPLLTNPSVQLVFEPADQLPDLVSDEGKVTQILRNLISNALKFTTNGEVRVSARHNSRDGLVHFTVADTGIGIAPRDHARIFEEFAQIENPLQRSFKGTGLGLPLSKSLAELIGGMIEVESEVGRGSTFTLTIPATFAPAAPAVDRSANRRRVLVIDDDESFRYVFKQIISNDKTFDVIEANDGREGLRRARDERPDVIVLDLQMPNIDGFSVMRELKADQQTTGIPVIVSTSLAVNSELKNRLPDGARIISKSLISRDTVSLFLRDALGSVSR